MLIPNKHSGYQAGVRLYPFGGGGSSEGSVPGMGDSQIGNTGGTTPIGTGVSIPPPTSPTVFVPGMGDSQIGNTGGTTPIGTGISIPPPATPTVSVPGMGNSQIGNTGGITPIGTGVNIPPVTPPFRPMSGADQFYQPVYQPQYQDYNVGNRMGVSQFGQGMGGFNPYAMQMQTPFNPYTNSFQSQMGMGMQSPFRSSGPARPIVTRSAQARGTPNVMMRRAEGGIASLVGDE